MAADTKSKKQRKLSKAKDKTKQEFGGFLEFIRTQGVVGLAIGFVIGTQAKVLVDQFTRSFISPFLIFIGSGDELNVKQFSLTINGKTANFAWGSFLFIFINFVITAALIYLAYRWLRLDKLEKKKD